MAAIAGMSPVAWQHINLFGVIEFSRTISLDSVYHKRRHTSAQVRMVPLPDFQVQDGNAGVASNR